MIPPPVEKNGTFYYGVGSGVRVNVGRGVCVGGSGVDDGDSVSVDVLVSVGDGVRLGRGVRVGDFDGV